MRVKYVAGGLMALACVCIPGTEASRWTKKKGRQEDDKQADKFADPLGLTRKQQQPATPQAEASFGDLAEQLAAFGGAEDFDLTTMMTTIIDGVIQQLESYKQQDAGAIKQQFVELLRSLPAGSSLPGLEAGAIEQLEQADGKELQQQVDTVLDAMLEGLRPVQKQLQEPGGLQAVVAANLKAAGVADADIEKMQEVISNPQAMRDAMQELTAGFESVADSLTEDDLQELQALLQNPEALNELSNDLLSDPDVKNALESSENSDLESLFAKFAGDPEVQAALEADKQGSSKSKGSSNKRSAENVPKVGRPGRRQRA